MSLQYTLVSPYTCVFTTTYNASTQSFTYTQSPLGPEDNCFATAKPDGSGRFVYQIILAPSHKVRPSTTQKRSLPATGSPIRELSTSLTGKSLSGSHHRINHLTVPTTVYVGDDGLDEIIEYPAGIPNPSPKGSIALPSMPNGLAEDSSGNIYVSMNNEAFVDQFNSSGILVRQFPQTCPTVHGLTIDSGGNLYVANQCHDVTQVLEYNTSSSSTQPIYTYGDSVHAQSYDGVVTDAQQNLYIGCLGGMGTGFVAKFPQKSQNGTVIVNDHAADYGVAILQDNDLVVASENLLTTYAPPNYNQVSQITYGAGSYTYLIATASDGTLYAPNYEGGVTPTVYVYPSNATPPYTITQGLEQPHSVAAGK